MNIEYDHESHHLHSIRLKNYDYSQSGAYFVTIATHQREMLFGQIKDDIMHINDHGSTVQSCWEQISLHFSAATTDAFVLMPNHVHGIIIIDYGGMTCRAPAESFGKPTFNSLPTIIRSFKSAVTRGINELRHTQGSSVWQRGYYEHVIRGNGEINQVREYISNNILQWALDRENPQNSRGVTGQMRQGDCEWKQ